LVACRNRCREDGGEIVDFLHRCPRAFALIWLRTVAHGGEVGHEILPILCREAEIEYAIEMRHHLIIAVEAAVVEIRRVEIRVAQGRCLEKTAGADVMLLMIDEGARG